MEKLKKIGRFFAIAAILIGIGGILFGVLGHIVPALHSQYEAIDAYKGLLEPYNGKPSSYYVEASNLAPSIKPMQGEPISESKISFAFEGKRYQIVSNVENEVYWGAFHADRIFTASVLGVEDAKVTQTYYRGMVHDSAQIRAIEEVIAQMRSIRDARGLDSDRYAELLIKFVQSIPYDEERALLVHQDKTAPGDPRFPVQVLADAKGDCDEKVFLLAALLNYEGYGVSALLFNQERHMSLGLLTMPGRGYKGSDYTYIETTALAYPSEVPAVLAGDIVIKSDPEILQLGEGDKYYSRNAMNEVAYILDARDAAKEEEMRLSRILNEERLDILTYNKYVRQYNITVEAHNTLNYIDPNSSSSEPELRYKDRTEAFSWLKENAYWMD